LNLGSLELNLEINSLLSQICLSLDVIKDFDDSFSVDRSHFYAAILVRIQWEVFKPGFSGKQQLNLTFGHNFIDLCNLLLSIFNLYDFIKTDRNTLFSVLGFIPLLFFVREHLILNIFDEIGVIEQIGNRYQKVVSHVIKPSKCIKDFLLFAEVSGAIKVT
jgi:hypothetical protein